MNMIPDNILRAVCWTLLHSLWQGLIFAIIAGTIMVLTKKASSALRYNLLCCGLLLFLAVGGYTFYLQLHTGGTTASVDPIVFGLNSGKTLPSVQDIPKSVQVSPGADLGPIPGKGYTLRTFVDSLVTYFDTHAAFVVVIWFILFMARFVKVLSGLVYAQRIRHYQTNPAPEEWQQRLKQLLNNLRISRPIALLESAMIKVPVVVGALKPVILVPVGMLAHLPADQVESILLHELAHIRRRDYLFNLVQHLVDTVFFFNPALIWISSLIRTERENCCDDIAIRETQSRRQLIEALVSFHEYRQHATQFAVAFPGDKENQVVKRVKRIVYKKNHSLNAGERVVLMGSLLILSAAFITINGNGNETATPQKNSTVALLKTVSVPATIQTTTPQTPKKQAEQQIPKPSPSITQQPNPAPVINPSVDTTIKGQKNSPDQPSRSDSGEGLNYLGYQNLSLDKIIELREHGVTADYILSFKKMGYTNISPDQAIELKDHGVTVEYIRELQGMGYQLVSLDQTRELRDHGVTVGFISRLKEIGFSHISLDEAKELIDHGVKAEYILACKKRFGKLFELNDYIKLRDANINPVE
jgi:beta-lactamase regulating signal transducer with metallopeptidase domain